MEKPSLFTSTYLRQLCSLKQSLRDSPGYRNKLCGSGGGGVWGGWWWRGGGLRRSAYQYLLVAELHVAEERRWQHEGHPEHRAPDAARGVPADDLGLVAEEDLQLHLDDEALLKHPRDRARRARRGLLALHLRPCHLHSRRGWMLHLAYCSVANGCWLLVLCAGRRCWPAVGQFRRGPNTHFNSLTLTDSEALPATQCLRSQPAGD